MINHLLKFIDRTGLVRSACVALTIALGYLLPVSPVRAVNRALPEALSTADWSGIRAAYEAGRHAAAPVAGGFAARNPRQAWNTRFDDRGFTISPDGGAWSWGLELTSYGRDDAERPIGRHGSLSASGGRVERAWEREGLREWYINDTRGLEHGYTIDRRPEGDGCLKLTLRVRGELTARVSTNGRDVSFMNANGWAVVNYSGLTVFDSAGATMPACFEVVTTFQGAANTLRLSVDDRGAVYPLTIDPIAQQAYLKATNTEVGDQFGYAVAASGDTVVVGSPQEDSSATGVNGNQADNGAPQSGAVYVFTRSGTAWNFQAYLKASNTAVGDGFGVSVAVSGDTVVVGASGEASNATGVNGNQANNSASAAGAAYVFTRAGTIWTQQAYLKASNTGAGDLFGWSVALSGDTVVVGAPQEASAASGVNGNQADNSAVSAGAAYVFFRTGTTWTQQAYLKASNTGAIDGFGASVAVSGDSVVVGASGEDSGATGVNGNQADNAASDAGAAYVFNRSGAIWTQQAYIKASNTAAGDAFGTSAVLWADTVVVGASGEDSGATGVNGNQADNAASDAGAAYVFNRSGAIWTQQAYLKASNTGTGDLFGSSIALWADTVVVGAWGEDSNAIGVNGNQSDNSASAAGAAYVFGRTGSAWTQQAYLKASNTGANDRFGAAVAASGNIVLAAAYAESSNATGMNGNQADNSASASGAAYLYLTTSGACCQGANCTLVFNVAACAGGGAAYLGDGSTCTAAGLYGPINLCCPADFNNSGARSVQDLFDFLGAWFASCP